MPLCLIVEDELAQRRVLADTLKSFGHEVVVSATGAEAIHACLRTPPELVLLDLGLPDVDGLDLIPRVLERAPLARIIVTTGRESVRAAVAALRAGARHYLVKPWELDELAVVVEREARAVDSAESARRLEAGEAYWGRHAKLARVRRHLGRLAAAPSTPVLIEGETGTGKEVLARELHQRTASGGLFVAVNCAAIPADLLESELFGHERGAFTGADSRQRGLVELARDGTLFLDEVGEMPAHLQAKLLRFLEGNRFRRVGGEEELCSPCRIVAATHQDLEAMQVSGAFRPDLFFRLAVVRLRVPPLRERREDLLGLADFPIVGRHLLATFETGHPDPARSQADSRHSRVDGYIAAAQYQHALAAQAGCLIVDLWIMQTDLA